MSTAIPFASISLDWHLGRAIVPCRVGGRLRGLGHAWRYGHLAIRSTDRGVPATEPSVLPEYPHRGLMVVLGSIRSYSGSV